MSTETLQVVVMGVAGTGKSTVARRIADELGMVFDEGDDHHGEQNIAKMAAGVPLTDADRLPWLRTLAEILAAHHAAGTSSVLTCSALRRSYRDILRSRVPSRSVLFVHLHAAFEVLQERMAQRQKHFMPGSLLQSQFDTLEPLEPDELGVRVDVTPPIDVVVARALEAVRAARTSPTSGSAGQPEETEES